MTEVPPAGWKFALDLVKGDRFFREQYEGPYIEIEVLEQVANTLDFFGRSFRTYACKRLDTGETGDVMFGDSGMVRTVIPEEE